ncbi:cell division protein FtsA [candidate division WOR-3 bacterium]|nr:cell division protein FtsA [candidate division WOR-3 bacterium]
MNDDKDIVVGLDLGTTKIASVIGEIVDDGINIMGVGRYPSEGLRKGIVINIDKTVQSILKAMREAEMMAGKEVSGLYTGIAGDHIRNILGRGVVAVTGVDNEVTESDVNRVLESAKSMALPVDREVIHIIPNEFILDGQGGIRDPVGMFSQRLEANVVIVTGAVNSAKNICKCVSKAGYEVNDIVLQPLASSYSVLSEEEKEIGSILIDIGGGTTDMAIFYNGSLRKTSVFGLGGENITNDIGIGLRTSPTEAERIKLEYGTVKEIPKKGEENGIMVQGLSGRDSKQVSHELIQQIVKPRVEEILTLAHRELSQDPLYDLLSAGIVLTGGTAKLEGIAELTEDIFGLPVSIGIPTENITGLKDAVSDPSFATCVGLLRYGVLHSGMRLQEVKGKSMFDTVLKRMKQWFEEFF